ncbi:MAG: hydroxyacid dehydrogenase [Hyphomicrobium sp.]|nr:hydroxyacid dehydrogenase [Hyphomicrobium sp.]PPD09525.1 MAG: hydroxyacid dehydrogenase [Hyphomicrobium sp.]
MSEGEFILYNTGNGRTQIQLRAVDGTVWLSQRQMAELFDKDVRTINEHISNIYEEAECETEATIRKFRIVQTEGKRQVSREVDCYSLDVILSVGYRVRSERGTQFRRWASTVLKDYMVKGFVMDDERLKDPAWDYFDELLERIRDIRASEARFYQKVRDILSLSEDYDPKSRQVTTFYATIQNKMLYAVTGHTAGELIAARSDASAPNMGLTTWKGADKGRPVRKDDVATAKNYLGELEIKELNLIVETFLNTAELRASRRQTMRLAEWEGVLNTFLDSNELPKLRNAGGITAKRAETIAHERYAEFDGKRKEAKQKDIESVEDLRELESIAKASKRRIKKGEGDA